MLSIVLPAFQEAESIRSVVEEILACSKDLDLLEIVIVDDGSRDATFEEIRALSAENRLIRGFRLSRNFGHQVALLAGLRAVKGDRVLMMDADGQHPPAMIPALCEKLEEGYDVVNTLRREAEGTGRMKRATSRWFYKLFNALSDTPIEPAAADFRIMNRQALDALLQIEESDRFTRGLVSWMGFRQTSLPYTAGIRRGGESAYSFRRMSLLAMDGLTSFSSKPLRLSTLLGAITLAGGLMYMIYALVMFFLGKTNPGWTSLLITVLILGGVQLFSIGILGEYLARVYRQGKNRPHYFISEQTGDHSSESR